MKNLAFFSSKDKSKKLMSSAVIFVWRFKLKYRNVLKYWDTKTHYISFVPNGKFVF